MISQAPSCFSEATIKVLLLLSSHLSDSSRSSSVRTSKTEAKNAELSKLPGSACREEGSLQLSQPNTAYVLLLKNDGILHAILN